MARPSLAPDRRQLSLFDEAPTPAGAPAAPPAGRGVVPAADTAPDPAAGTSPARPRAGAKPPAVPGPAVAAPPLRFDHPRAQRRVSLDGHTVGYEFRRGKRRSIGFVVGAEGLSVSAPRWVAVQEVEQALQAKAGWILRKLHEQRERADRLQAARIEWRDGTSLPFLGDTVIVVLDPRVTGAVLNAGGDGLPGVARMTLHVGLPQSATQAQIREAVQSWLQRQARRIFESRCEHFAQQLGVRVRRLSISSAATRWGSASADGSVRLNWRLVHFAMPVIDYVVTHELAHLREMNHSSAFWEVVRSVLPDYERSRGALRTEVLPSFD
ncbi:M48 family metallopeptidase [Ideonella sp. A 288]|uniref:M48 family metallopeptidase n=1 Tax=Ideonella sp. A 288 TaxID=1962181 RepID=UPI000B4BF391|nr:SprT family zinc-dependent metalloprotease [Ideonella sp. A 288]